MNELLQLNGLTLTPSFSDWLNRYIEQKWFDNKFVLKDAVNDFADYFVKEQLSLREGFVFYKVLTQLGLFSLLDVVREDLTNKNRLGFLFWDVHNRKSLALSSVLKKHRNGPLANKKIAIFGPSDNNVELTAEKFSEFDFIVVLGLQSLENYNFGRPIINYLNKHAATALQEEDVPDLKCEYRLKGLFEKSSFVDQLIQESRAKFIQTKSHFFFGTPHLLQLCLMDLALEGAADFSIYNCNFYLNKKTYAESYTDIQKGFDDDKIAEVLSSYWSFVTHDPSSQVVFTQKMAKHLRIQGDEIFEEIMDMSSQEYLLRLDQTFAQKTFMGKEA